MRALPDSPHQVADELPKTGSIVMTFWVSGEWKLLACACNSEVSRLYRRDNVWLKTNWLLVMQCYTWVCCLFLWVFPPKWQLLYWDNYHLRSNLRLFQKQILCRASCCQVPAVDNPCNGCRKTSLFCPEMEWLEKPYGFAWEWGMNPPNSHVNIRIYNTDICQLEKMRNHLAFGHRI